MKEYDLILHERLRFFLHVIWNVIFDVVRHIERPQNEVTHPNKPLATYSPILAKIPANCRVVCATHFDEGNQPPTSKVLALFYIHLQLQRPPNRWASCTLFFWLDKLRLPRIRRGFYLSMLAVALALMYANLGFTAPSLSGRSGRTHCSSCEIYSVEFTRSLAGWI